MDPAVAKEGKGVTRAMSNRNAAIVSASRETSQRSHVAMYMSSKNTAVTNATKGVTGAMSNRNVAVPNAREGVTGAMSNMNAAVANARRGVTGAMSNRNAAIANAGKGVTGAMSNTTRNAVPVVANAGKGVTCSRAICMSKRNAADAKAKNARKRVTCTGVTCTRAMSNSLRKAAAVVNSSIGKGVTGAMSNRNAAVVANAGKGVACSRAMSNTNAEDANVANTRKRVPCAGVTCTRAMSNRVELEQSKRVVQEQSKKKKRHIMELHLVRGSLITRNAVGGEIMEAEVWSQLPEELIWEVLRFVPAANSFQLQLVSRQWRQVLISADFCSQSRVVVQPPVVACVTRTDAWARGDHTSHSSSSATEVENKVVVDIDLSSFVPGWFWKSDHSDPDLDAYRVVTAADGLVCISNHKGYFREDDNRGWGKSSTKDYYCVLNPLTRTCKVLPDVPFDRWAWLRPTPTALTIIGYMLGTGTDHLGQDLRWRGHVHVATYDLTAGRSGKWELAAACKPDTRRYGWRAPNRDVELCAGEMFWLAPRWVAVAAVEVVPRFGEGPAAVEVPAHVEEPSLETLGLDASRWHGSSVCMVAHRGAVYFLMSLFVEVRSDEVDVVLGVWRLARERLKWEVAARLGVADVVRLTGVKRSDFVSENLEGEETSLLALDGASGVREFLYCTMSAVGEADWRQFVVGFNLDTGDWELVHDGQGLFYDATISYYPSWTYPSVSHPSRQDVSSPLELRPDLFVHS